MRIKILTENSSDNLEKQLNIFLVEISDKKIIDIKFQKTLNSNYSALVIYK